MFNIVNADSVIRMLNGKGVNFEKYDIAVKKGLEILKRKAISEATLKN